MMSDDPSPKRRKRAGPLDEPKKTNRPNTMGPNSRLHSDRTIEAAKRMTGPEYQALWKEAEATNDPLHRLEIVSRMMAMEANWDLVIKACAHQLPYTHIRREVAEGLASQLSAQDINVTVRYADPPKPVDED